MGHNGKEEREAIHLRFGKGLLDRIDRAAWDTGIPRNTWIAEAVERRLTGVFAVRRTTAEELIAHRVAFMIRLSPNLVELLDESAKDDGVTRTIWLMDACLSACKPG